MSERDFKEISPEMLLAVGGNAWSMENMEAHGAGGRAVEYMGSRMEDDPDPEGRERKVFDYYRDSQGDYWYKTRVLPPAGEIVSMEKYLFGYEPRRGTGTLGKKQRYRRF